MEFRQTQKLEQGLALTPQLTRSLEILQKPSIELRQTVAEELRTNPLLEDVGAVEISAPEAAGGAHDDVRLGGEARDFEIYREPRATVSGGMSQETRDFVMNSIPDKVSLQEYLLNEANLDAKNRDVSLAFANLVGSMDERGFLGKDALQNAHSAGFSEETVQEALKLLRHCEPAGIGAFDMRDSLMLQLKRKKMSESLAYRILDRYYELLMKRKVEDIAQAEKKSARDIEDAIAQIAKLNTSPAYEFTSDEERYITPDLRFFKKGDKWHVELTNEHVPKLRINPDYREMMAQGRLRKEEESYVKEKIRDGKFLMDAIEQRQKTLLKIGEVILERQLDFFEKSPDAMRPMTMQDVADAVELHATTVGRAVADKYAQTPRGILPLKYFFSGGYDSGGGESIASASVKNKIRDIVAEESPQSPLSDSKIADILARDNINIARRTVAKYREELGIAPKNLRKRF